MKRTGPARVVAIEDARSKRRSLAVVVSDGPDPLPQEAADLLLEMLARGRARKGA